ncbi:hypothetical protein CTI12_AA165910 [Artemisia annua]|uniref:COI1 F-box domain-containing protein n=1 Tax=Artemisia annua TaxID=35608 RepID=A0A2U1PCX8_ARTAN|nr:hypothetical protein CTI12_AA165910 [Artemisia annua]
METVLDCVVNYLHDANDRNSLSLVSHTCYDVDAKTRKHVTAHLCYATPLRCRQRFPFIKSLTLTGSPHIVNVTSSPCNWDHNVTPWVEEIAASFKRLKVVRFQNLVVHDSDLELLARTRGFSTDGLLYIGKYCNHLKILNLESSSISEKNGEWLYELALHNTSIESLNFYKAGLTKFDVKDLALIAKNCSQRLVSVKVSKHYEFTDLVEFFSYAVKLEDFGDGSFVKNNNPINHDHFGMDAVGVYPNIPFAAQRAKYKDFKFPPKLKGGHNAHHYSLIVNCPNLEILYTAFITDGGLEHLGKYCKNLRKLYVTSRTEYVTEKGLLSLASGCPKLECLRIYLSSITYDIMAYIGMQMKNLYELSMVLLNKGVRKKNLVLDKGIRTLLIGCNKLERLSICFEELGGLRDEGLKNIGMCGYNLRYLSLGYVGESDAGLVELSFGCPKLQNLVIKNCPFSKEAFDIFRCNVPSLRYFDVQGIPRHCRYLLEEDQPNFKQIV